MANFKRLSVLFVVLCLALCLVFAVSCTNDNGDTSTNTNTDTSTDTSTNTNTDTNTDTSTDTSTDAVQQGYTVRLADEEGNTIKVAGAMISHCPIDSEGACISLFDFEATGVFSLGEDGNTRYISGVFVEGYKSISEAHIVFEEGQTELVIVLEAE